jgi:hypothetical protein
MGATMTDYRIYFLTQAGHVAGPSRIVTCDSDEKAMELAAPMVNGFAVELWDGARVVGNIPSTAKPIERRAAT